MRRPIMRRRCAMQTSRRAAEQKHFWPKHFLGLILFTSARPLAMRLPQRADGQDWYGNQHKSRRPGPAWHGTDARHRLMA